MRIAARTITNVRIFDGERLTPPRTVSMVDGLIDAVTDDAVTDHAGPADGDIVDGGGATLLPGLIDCHIHLTGRADLEAAAHWGITTMLDMATPSPELVDGLRGLPGLTDIRSAGSPASGPGGIQTRMLGFPEDTAVSGPDDAERFVAQRVSEGSDYLKIIVEDPAQMGPAALGAETVAALGEAARRHGLRTYAHATTVASVRLAAEAGVDVITHVPIDAPLDPGTAADIRERGIVVVPTLVMMRGAVQMARTMGTHGDEADYAHSVASVAALLGAGVQVLAGTDANSHPASPFGVAHGSSLHDELGLLVEAGMSPAEALRSATSRPAALWGLGDRGAIRPGLRADLLLVEGDPTHDLEATRQIDGVWIAGQRVR